MTDNADIMLPAIQRCVVRAWVFEELPLEGLVCGRDDSMALSLKRPASLYKGEP